MDDIKGMERPLTLDELVEWFNVDHPARAEITRLRSELQKTREVLDWHDIAMPGGSTEWSLADRVLIACRAAVSHEAPEGWQLVPKEPTDEMLQAFEDTYFLHFACTPANPWTVAEKHYSAMLSAAPSPTGTEKGE